MFLYEKIKQGDWLVGLRWTKGGNFPSSLPLCSSFTHSHLKGTEKILSVVRPIRWTKSKDLGCSQPIFISHLSAMIPTLFFLAQGPNVLSIFSTYVRLLCQANCYRPIRRSFVLAYHQFLCRILKFLFVLRQFFLLKCLAYFYMFVNIFSKAYFLNVSLLFALNTISKVFSILYYIMIILICLWHLAFRYECSVTIIFKNRFYIIEILNLYVKLWNPLKY